MANKNETVKLLVFDNYDSFTYNLVHMVSFLLQQSVTVYRNDEISLEAINDFDKIILSPGPGIPDEAGLLLPLIRQYAPTKSILGVCLGHQAIGEAFGAKLTNLSKVFHGVATEIHINPKVKAKSNSWFNHLPTTIEVGRYHSWIINKDTLPKELEVTAVDEAGNIMAVQHTTYDVQGVQFHPESILTPLGEEMLRNWLFPGKQ
ncbi:anthranilate synthase component II [Hydrotalea sp.]|uniref:anthranilate synthase component II n=1 Tax=Hydrotalea sp. TaxID=2881279 RepID=UPI003D0CD8F3